MRIFSAWAQALARLAAVAAMAEHPDAWDTPEQWELQQWESSLMESSAPSQTAVAAPTAVVDPPDTDIASAVRAARAHVACLGSG